MRAGRRGDRGREPAAAYGTGRGGGGGIESAGRVSRDLGLRPRGTVVGSAGWGAGSAVGVGGDGVVGDDRGGAGTGGERYRLNVCGDLRGAGSVRGAAGTGHDRLGAAGGRVVVREPAGDAVDAVGGAVEPGRVVGLPSRFVREAARPRLSVRRSRDLLLAGTDAGGGDGRAVGRSGDGMGGRRAERRAVARRHRRGDGALRACRARSVGAGLRESTRGRGDGDHRAARRDRVPDERLPDAGRASTGAARGCRGGRRR